MLTVLICRQLYSQEKQLILYDSLSSQIVVKIKSGKKIKYSLKGENKEIRTKVCTIEENFMITRRDTVYFESMNTLSVRKFDFAKVILFAYCVGSSSYFFIKFPSIEAFNKAGTFTKVWGVSGLLTNIPASIYLAANPYSYKVYYLSKKGTCIRVVEH
ncbi:MAG: hypothetical protein D8M18_02400 [Bacteroidetes bacterium]|nr:hypothetical protein [Bacteroidota bacterium]